MQETRVIQEYCRLRQIVVSVAEEISPDQGASGAGRYLKCLNREEVCAELGCKYASGICEKEEINDPF